MSRGRGLGVLAGLVLVCGRGHAPSSVATHARVPLKSPARAATGRPVVFTGGGTPGPWPGQGVLATIAGGPIAFGDGNLLEEGRLVHHAAAHQLRGRIPGVFVPNPRARLCAACGQRAADGRGVPDRERRHHVGSASMRSRPAALHPSRACSWCRAATWRPPP